MSFVVINGVKSTTVKGLLISSLPPISKPLMRTTIEEVDGRDGDIITNLGFSAYDKPMEIGLFGDYDVDQVIEFFATEGTIIFSNEPDKFYNFQVVSQIDFERLIRFKTATVTFHVQPYKYSAVDDVFDFSPDLMNLKEFSAEKLGLSCTCSDGTITLTGQAQSTTSFYVPIYPLFLKAGTYNLQALTSGTGESGCAIRLIDQNPVNSESFGNTVLQLDDDGESVLNATLAQTMVFHYLWIYVEQGAEVNFTMDAKVLDANNAITVINRGNTLARPVMTIYGEGTVVLYINGAQVFTINMGSAEYITIDSEKMNAYQGDFYMNRYVTGNYDELALQKGENVISWTGTVTHIEMENFSRWI